MSVLAAPPAKAESARIETLRMLLHSKTFVVGVVIVGFWIFCAVFGERVAPHDPLAQSLDILQAPGSRHFFGTDTLGRDVFSRVLTGAHDVLLVAPLATLVGIVGGTVVGLTSGYLGGLADDVISRIVDAVLSIPVVIIAVTVLVALGSSTLTLVVVIGIVFTPIVSRTVRAATLAERRMDYVQAARLGRERAPYIMFREILPNVMGPVIVEATVRLGYAIFTVAGLTFLGFGVQPPSPDWAVQITEHYTLLSDTAHSGYYWTVVFPGAAIASLVIGVNLIADGLQHAFDQ